MKRKDDDKVKAMPPVKASVKATAQPQAPRPSQPQAKQPPAPASFRPERTSRNGPLLR